MSGGLITGGSVHPDVRRRPVAGPVASSQPWRLRRPGLPDRLNSATTHWLAWGIN